MSRFYYFYDCRCCNHYDWNYYTDRRQGYNIHYDEYLFELESENYDQTPELMMETRKEKIHDNTTPNKPTHEEIKTARKLRRNLRQDRCRQRQLRTIKKANRKLVKD